MNDNQTRTYQLQQIPVFAIRKLLFSVMRNKRMPVRIGKRIRKLWGHEVRKPERVIERLNQEKLIALINNCPEIDDTNIKDLFEEYRYGTNPSFHIYVFDKKLTLRSECKDIQPIFDKEIRKFNRGLPKNEPSRVKKLTSSLLREFPKHPEIIEGDYHYQRRIDIIDKNENAASIYETLYGFFWINTRKGYVIIHANDHEILQALESSICKGIGNLIQNLVITKELKNSLPFLFEKSLRSCRLHDPFPESKQFRWMSIGDDDPYKKGYQEWEDRYPEISNARYRIDVGDKKERSLNIGFDTGTMSLAGRLTATQFRRWALKRLEEIIHIVQSFNKKPGAYLHTRRFQSIPELNKYSVTQKAHINYLISLILDLKHGRGIGYRETGVSPLVLAHELGELTAVQYLLKCRERDCGMEDYVGCKYCKNSAMFHVGKLGNQWYLECIQHRSTLRAAKIPLKGQCEKLHDFEISEKEIGAKLEIFPSDELLRLIGNIVHKYIPKFNFDTKTESFMIRGTKLYYYQNQNMSYDARFAQQVTKNYFKAYVKVGTVKGNGVVIKGIDLNQPKPVSSKSTVQPSK